MIELLSLRGFAARVKVEPGTLRRYRVEGRLPQPDAVLTDGDKVRYFGWFPETVDNWNKQRPGRGARTDLTPTKPAAPQRKRSRKG
ncbi:hypothetical protein A5658_03350 [Mycobacterium sp. 1245111.1]|uniref:hypothetical protein n=1 Tax=Mycobacterium sp. 1245111.1 TaxID=1834073 RepID=UPI0008019994|nr:hypothetical protein [Mycobacterium sp. 1245111.1]OBK38569.1 hypothetical protein A5658_03350 [Mycobacterium sp. 1245111.1]